MSITGLAYLLIVFGGSVLSLSGRPFFGLLVYVFTFYLYAPGSWWGYGLPSLRWSLLAAMVTLVGIIIQGKKTDAGIVNKIGFFSVPEYQLFGFFVLWVWIQNIWAIAPGYHMEYSVMASKLLLLLFLMHKTLLDENRIVIFILANLMGCAYFGWIGLTEHSGGRFETVPTPGLDDGNLLSLHMGPILLLGAFLLLCNFKKWKFLLIIPIALTMNAIFLTQSRGAIVGIVVGGFLALLFRPKPLRGQINIYLILACFAAVMLVPADLINRLDQAAGPEEERDASAESRIVIIEAQLRMFSEAPLHGYGHRGTLMLSPDFIESTYLTSTKGGKARGSHNLLMSLLVDYGLVGALLYISIIFSFVKRLFSLRSKIINLNRENDNLLIIYLGGTCALVTLMVSSMFSNSLRLEIDILLIGLLSAVYLQITSKYLHEKSS